MATAAQATNWNLELEFGCQNERVPRTLTRCSLTWPRGLGGAGARGCASGQAERSILRLCFESVLGRQRHSDDAAARRLGAEANKHITAEGPSSLGPFQSRSLVSWAIERGVVSWPQFAACLFMDDVHFAFLVSLPLALPIHAFEHLRPSRSRTLPTVVQSHPPAWV